MKDKYKSPWRKDPTAPHPLFEGDIPLYQDDQAWRSDIPKAGSEDQPASGRAARAVLSWGQRGA